MNKTVEKMRKQPLRARTSKAKSNVKKEEVDVIYRSCKKSKRANKIKEGRRNRKKQEFGIK